MRFSELVEIVNALDGVVDDDAEVKIMDCYGDIVDVGDIKRSGDDKALFIVQEE